MNFERVVCEAANCEHVWPLRDMKLKFYLCFWSKNMPSRKVKIILGPINEYLIFVAIFFNNRTFSKELMKSLTLLLFGEVANWKHVWPLRDVKLKCYLCCFWLKNMLVKKVKLYWSGNEYRWLLRFFTTIGLFLKK